MSGMVSRRLIVIILLFGLFVPVPVQAGGGKKQFKQGRIYETDKKFDRAAEAYLAALGEDESNLEYRIAYQRASTQASVMLVRQGREALEQGGYEDAYNAFRRAYQFDKTNELAKDLATQALGMQRKREGIAPVPVTETPYGATPPIIQGSRTGASPQRSGSSVEDQAVAPEKDRVRENIIFRNQELEEIIRNLTQRVGLNVVFDSNFRSRKLSFEMRDVSVAQALDTILLSNNLFFEPVNDNTIIVSLDNTANRSRLQQMSVQTFYLKSSDEQTVQTIQTSISALFGQQRVMVVPNAQLRSLTVRTTPETLKLVGDVIRALDKDKPEVLIDVSIYEVSRTGALQIGNQLLYDGFFGSSSPSGPLVPGSLSLLGVTAGQILSHGKLMVAIPTTIIQALQSRGNSRLIDSLQVHALDGQATTANIGQRIPIQTASLPSSYATVQSTQTSNSQTTQGTADRVLNSLSLGVPQIEYQNVGLNVKITPTIYSDDDVKLDMEIETSGFNEGPSALTPIFTQRNLKSVSTIKTGQAAMMAALAHGLTRESRTSLPIIGFVPVLGRLFSIPSESSDMTDLVITVTPHVIRTADIRDEDKLAKWSGLQLMGVSESVESFLERKEQVRQRRQQAASQAEVAKNQAPGAATGNQTIAAGDPSPATGDQKPPSQRPLTGDARPAADGLIRTVSSQDALPVSSFVAESKLPAMDRADVGAVNPPPNSSISGLADVKAGRAEAGVVTLELRPGALQPRVGDTLKVTAFARSDQPIQQGNFVIRFDSSALRVKNVVDGGLLAAGGQAARVSFKPDPSGSVVISVEAVEKVSAKPGQLPLVIIDFEVLASGNSAMTVAPESTRFKRPDGQELSVVPAPVAVSAKE